jgi:CheY-like chemotaxis protein/DNA-binding CsgD family transcriptional regulator
MQKKLKALQEDWATPQAYEQAYSPLYPKGVSQERPPTILVVDDDEINVHIFKGYLEADYEILFATSGERALEIAASNDQPDLILLDIVMPGMDGYEVCARLRAGADTRDIPVIFVTALDQAVDETKGFNLGAVDFITKPFSMPVVQARIKAAMQLKQEMDKRILLTEKLTDANRALKALLDQREIEKKSIEQTMVVNLKRYVFPYLEALDRLKMGDDVQSYVNIIRTNIEQLISPVSKRLSGAYLDLTPTEIKVADLIRQNKPTKSIARKLNTSPSTVEKHRNKIRKKLNILHKKVNLNTYLNSLAKEPHRQDSLEINK